MIAFFVTDLHGKVDRYDKLFEMIMKERPNMVFIGGDLLPHAYYNNNDLKLKNGDFIIDFIGENLSRVKDELKQDYPAIFAIMGNDDARVNEDSFIELDEQGLWQYCHNKRIDCKGFNIFGYSYVPPTPFLLKDWERYDVSRYADPGCIHPDVGMRSVEIKQNHIEHSTIDDDLKQLTEDEDLSKSIFLFHSPPYETDLDRAALDGEKVDYVPLDVHVGSIAIRRFIEKRQPLITMHGHIHESTRITGSWMCQIERAYCFQGAHHGKRLSVIKFDPDDPGKANRILV